MNAKKRFLFLSCCALIAPITITGPHDVENRWKKQAEYIENVNVIGVTDLAKALSAGDSKAATAFIKLGANLQARTVFGTNLLHCAAMKPDNLHVVELLINYGIDVNQKDITLGITPLFVAICFGNDAIAHLLMESGADVNVKIKGLDVTPLHVAALLRHGKICRDLVEHGADINAETSLYHLTPLHLLNTQLKLEPHEGVLPAFCFMIDKGDANQRAIADYIGARGGKGDPNDILKKITTDCQFIMQVEKIAQDPSCIDIHARNTQDGTTQLHVATTSAYRLESAKRLILAGADINARENPLDATPPHSCMSRSNAPSSRTWRRQQY